MNKSLKSVFASLLTGAAISLSVYDLQAQTDDNMVKNNNETDPNHVEIIKTTPEWERLVNNNAITFEDDVDSNQVATPYARAVMVERDFANKGHFLLLLKGSASDRDAAIDLNRHGEAAAAILKNEVSKDSVEVNYMEWPENVTKWLYDTKSPVAQTLLRNTDVVTLSMGWPAKGDQEKVCSVGPVDTYEEIEDADHFWDQSKAIFVTSAGNSGGKTDSEIERSHAVHSQRAANYIPVGESRLDENGIPYVVEHSSRVSDIGFVVDNPFYEDFSYRYWKTVDELAEEFSRFYDQEVPGTGMTGREFFTFMLETLPEEEVRQKLKAVHPEFEKVSFAGKEALEQDIMWIRDNPEKVLEGFINGIATSAKNKIIISNILDKADEQGRVSKLSGTSFTAPRAGGMIADMAAKYPQFSKRVLVAAALLAAEPLDKVAVGMGEEKELIFKDNGSGVPYNSAIAGFGRLTKGNYEKVMAKIVELSRADAELGANDCYVSSDLIHYEEDSSLVSEKAAFTDYKINVAGDVTVVSSHLTLEFNSENNFVPLKITLISPSGGEVDISPTKPKKEILVDRGLSLGRSLGHLGVQGQGEWTVRVHHSTFKAPVKAAQLTLKGFERSLGSNLIDAYICQFGGDIPLEDNAPSQQAKVDQVKPSNIKIGL